MNQQSGNLQNMSNFEISERSLNIYKKYAEDATKFKISTGKIPKQLSLSEISSSYSIISTPPSKMRMFSSTNLRTDDPKQDGSCFSKFLNFDLNTDPIKQLSEDSLSVYLKHLNVGYRGAQEPGEADFKLYESLVKQISESF